MDLAGYFKDTAQAAGIFLLTSDGQDDSPSQLPRRAVTQEDLFRLMRIFIGSFPHAAKALGARLRSRLESDLSNSSVSVVGAFTDESLRGFAIVYHAQGTVDPACLAYVASDGLMRGRGLGAALLRAVEIMVRERGSPGLVLQVRASNVKAQRLYGKSGYERIATYPQGYSDGETAYELGKWWGYSSAGVYRKLSR